MHMLYIARTTFQATSNNMIFPNEFILFSQTRAIHIASHTVHLSLLRQLSGEVWKSPLQSWMKIWRFLTVKDTDSYLPLATADKLLMKQFHWFFCSQTWEQKSSASFERSAFSLADSYIGIHILCTCVHSLTLLNTLLNTNTCTH